MTQTNSFISDYVSLFCSVSVSLRMCFYECWIRLTTPPEGLTVVNPTPCSWWLFFINKYQWQDERYINNQTVNQGRRFSITNRATFTQAHNGFWTNKYQQVDLSNQTTPRPYCSTGTHSYTSKELYMRTKYSMHVLCCRPLLDIMTCFTVFDP